MKLTKPIKEQKKPSIKLGELNREVSRLERRKEPEGSGERYIENQGILPELLLNVCYAINAWLVIAKNYIQPVRPES